MVPAVLGSGSSIPYLATVRSLAQSQHLLQSLGHDLLPLVQKLPFLITEIKAKAHVKVPRAAAGGIGEPQAKPIFHRRRPALYRAPQKDSTRIRPAHPLDEWIRQESPYTASLAQESS